MEIVFLGTGPAWGLPEFMCECQICKHMRRIGEIRSRSGLLLKTKKNILIDCSPDIKTQLSQNNITSIDYILISHEHNDHYMGLDDLFPYKRTKPRGEFKPIELLCSEKTYAEISNRFKYLETFEVIKPTIIKENQWYEITDIAFMPFKTYHGDSAKGSVGFLIRFLENDITLVYTSDMMDIPQFTPELKRPHYLVIQSFWLNEPVENRPKHLSFQRAIDFIRIFDPKKACFLVHMGDGDSIPGDPQNNILKKYPPKDPLRHPQKQIPYPIPTCHEEWQLIVDTIRWDYGLDWPIYVAKDNYKLTLP